MRSVAARSARRYETYPAHRGHRIGDALIFDQKHSQTSNRQRLPAQFIGNYDSALGSTAKQFGKWNYD